MGKSQGSAQPTSSTVTNTTSVPSWLETPMVDNIAKANQIADKPYEKNPYTGIENFNSTQQAAQQAALGNVGAATPGMQAGMDLVQQAGSTDPGHIQAQTYANGLQGIGAYMNPYTQQVEDAAKANMAEAFKGNLNTIADRSIGQGAFGGSRQGVAEGAAASEYSRQMGDMSAQLRAANYGQATQQLGQDITNDLSAQAKNQQTDLDSIKNRTAAGLGMGNLSQIYQQMLGQDVNTMSNVGAQNQAMTQAQRDLQASQWSDEQNHDLQSLNLRMGAVSNTPMPASSTSNTTSYGQRTSGNAGMSLLGGGLAGAQLGSTLAGAAGVSSGMGTGIGSLLGGLLAFSDEDAKTDVSKVGTDPGTGIDLFAYRYKGDPKSYPKVVGPMAQDIAKKFPRAVQRVGGPKGKLAVSAPVLQKIRGNGLAGGLG